MKLLILVANSNSYPSNLSIPSIIRAYSKSGLDSNKYEFMVYQGDHESNTLHNNVLKLKIPGNDKNVGKKVLAAFSWVYKNIEFDYLVRITTSTYLDVKSLYEYINLLDHVPNYGGDKLVYYDKIKKEKVNFASGANLVLSKKCVKILIDNKNSWDHNQYDDVNIGKILHENLKIDITQFNIQKFENYPLKKDINLQNYHFRFRLDLYNFPRFLEVLVFEIIHFRVVNKNNKSIVYKFCNLLIDLLAKPLFFVFQKINPKIYTYKFRSFKYRTGVKIREMLTNLNK